MNDLLLAILGIEKRGYRMAANETTSDGRVVAVAISRRGLPAKAEGRDEETATFHLYDVLRRP